MRALKPLNNDGYTRNTYTAYISQSYVISSGSEGNTELVTIDFAEQPPVGWTSQTTSDTDLGSYNQDSEIYSYPLFSLLNHVFYSSQSVVEYGTESIAVTKYKPTGSLYVFNIANDAVGEGIGAGTFSIRTSGSAPVLDDGYGRLYVNDTGSVIGNVFYKHGIAIVQNNTTASVQSISPDGLRIIAYEPLTIQFSSSFSITEHTIICKLKPTDFNTTVFNPTVGYYKTVTGSYVSGSSTITYTNNIPNVSSSAKALSGELLGDLFDSGTLTPYVTSIGLYNNNYELLGIAKLSSPVPRTKNVEQTFIIKFDT